MYKNDSYLHFSIIKKTCVQSKNTKKTYEMFKKYLVYFFIIMYIKI